MAGRQHSAHPRGTCAIALGADVGVPLPHGLDELLEGDLLHLSSSLSYWCNVFMKVLALLVEDE